MSRSNLGLAVASGDRASEGFGILPTAQPIEGSTNTAINLNVRAIRTRIATFGDVAHLPQAKWIEIAYPNNTLTGVSESYITDICPSRSDFDLLVVTGNDVRRVRQLLRLYRPILRRKPKIAVLQSSSPRDRAILLNAGFDDVMDPRMPVPEGQARAVSLVKRYDMTIAGLPRVAADETPDVERMISGPLSRREAEVCGLLLARSPEPVAIAALSRSIGGLRPIARSSLRVLISNLRTRLRRGVSIEYTYPSAYAVVFDAEAAAQDQ